MNKKIELIAAATNISVRQVLNTIELFDGGATIPFVARYRKERTGGLDEEQLEDILKQNEYFTDIIILSKKRR